VLSGGLSGASPATRLRRRLAAVEPSSRRPE
jgi:hypothetical protein